MKTTCWPLVDLASRLLDPDDREAVRGDLIEAGETSWQALLGILGLVARREAALWRNWKPWLAALGLALPCSLAWMGLSLTVTQAYGHLFSAAYRPSLLLFLINVLLLIGWAWAGGFAAGSISRRTLWVSAAFSFIPCLFCLTEFHVESLSRFCLLLFLPPAVWGAMRGMRIARIKLSAAIVLALGITFLTIPAWPHSGPWIPNWALSWPAWYLVATAKGKIWRLN